MDKIEINRRSVVKKSIINIMHRLGRLNLPGRRGFNVVILGFSLLVSLMILLAAIEQHLYSTREFNFTKNVFRH